MGRFVLLLSAPKHPSDSPGHAGCLIETGRALRGADMDVGATDVRATKRKNMQLMTFSDLGLSAPILQALQSEGYAAPTPIQAKAIPIALAGRDLLGIAQTGTGKTAAFALPIM